MKLEDLTNEYGNIQKKDIIGKPEFAHVRGLRLQLVCRPAGIEFAPCIDGYKRSGGRYNPVKDGIVIYSVDLEKMKAGIEDYGKRNTPEVQEKRRLEKENRYRKEQKQFALEIRERFPFAPQHEEFHIAERACEVGSGRVGRSNTAEDPVHAAVVAHIRHTYTDYDGLREDLKSEGFECDYARDEAHISIKSRVREIVNEWKTGSL